MTMRLYMHTLRSYRTRAYRILRPIGLVSSDRDGKAHPSSRGVRLMETTTDDGFYLEPTSTDPVHAAEDLRAAIVALRKAGWKLTSEGKVLHA